MQKEQERNADLHLQLSEKYMAYKDLADRCLINPDHVGKYNKCYISNEFVLFLFRKGRAPRILHETEKPVSTGAKSAELVPKRVREVNRVSSYTGAAHFPRRWSSQSKSYFLFELIVLFTFQAYLEQTMDKSNPALVKDELCNFFKRR